MRLVSTILFLLTTTFAFCQYTNRTDYDLKVPSRDNRQKHCGKLMTMLNQLPPEVQFESRVIGDSVYLLFNNQKLFWQFFEDKKDGFAIDLVNQD